MVTQQCRRKNHYSLSHDVVGLAHGLPLHAGMHGAEGAGVELAQGVDEAGVQARGLGAHVGEGADLLKDGEHLLLALTARSGLGVGVVEEQVGAAERA
jgi:hypothetical protein